GESSRSISTMIGCHGSRSWRRSPNARPDRRRDAMSADGKTSVPELGETFAELRPDLLRHCYRMLGSFEEAEDIVQDVLLRAWRARDTYAGDAPLSHWLMRIATNACLNALTRGRTRALPQLARAPAGATTPIEELE